MALICCLLAITLPAADLFVFQNSGWTPKPPGLNVESKFRLKHITEEWDKYDHLVGVVPCASVRLILDLLENPDETRPFTLLK
jgi:hypothetical protein